MLDVNSIGTNQQINKIKDRILYLQMRKSGITWPDFQDPEIDPLDELRLKIVAVESEIKSAAFFKTKCSI